MGDRTGYRELGKVWLAGLMVVAIGVIVTFAIVVPTSCSGNGQSPTGGVAVTPRNGSEPDQSPDAGVRIPADVVLSPQPRLQTLEVMLGGERFDLELALTHFQRFKGLSDREVIEPDGGMLFVFPESRPLQFVMRRCLVPIDLIFLDSWGVITTLHEMEVEPEPFHTPDSELRTYPSDGVARFAIEVAGGTIARLGLRVDQTIRLPLDDLKAKAR